MSEDRKPKPISGYHYAVMTFRPEQGTPRGWLVPLGATFRETLKDTLGDPESWPPGRVEITIPETLPEVEGE